MKITCISGISGQTGSYLAERCLNEGHKVYGMIRKSSSFNTGRIDHIFNDPNLELIYGDLSDTGTVNNFISKCKPDYFFNMGAMSHVKASFELPEYVFDIDATGVVRILESIRLYSPHTRLLQASTSELFGSSPPKQNENTPMWPKSPYGCAKLAAYWMVKNYRQGYGLFAVNSISFNHESKRRPPTFLTMKVVRGLCRIKLGLQKELVLGNLHAKRSWNHVNDIIDGMMLMINADIPDDYVIGSNDMLSVQEFVEKVAFKLNINWKNCVKTDPKYYRPNEVNELEPDPTKIKNELGWSPKYSIDDIIDEMIEEEIKLANNEILINNGTK
jgi:GDPmannose 4,6-dehydratase